MTVPSPTVKGFFSLWVLKYKIKNMTFFKSILKSLEVRPLVFSLC